MKGEHFSFAHDVTEHVVTYSHVLYKTWLAAWNILWIFTARNFGLLQHETLVFQEPHALFKQWNIIVWQVHLWFFQSLFGCLFQEIKDTICDLSHFTISLRILVHTGNTEDTGSKAHIVDSLHSDKILLNTNVYKTIYHHLCKIIKLHIHTNK